MDDDKTIINSEDYIDIRSQLAKIRKAKGFTQNEIGDRLGVSIRTIQFYENHQRGFNQSRLKLLFKALEVTPNEFFEWPDDGVQRPPLVLPPDDYHEMNALTAVTKFQTYSKEELKKVYESVCHAKSLLEAAMCSSREDLGWVDYLIKMNHNKDK